MTVANMRDEISNVYDTKSWKNKVDEMYDDQVIAIYYNLMRSGKLNKVLKRAKPEIHNATDNAVQLDFFDLIK